MKSLKWLLPALLLVAVTATPLLIAQNNNPDEGLNDSRQSEAQRRAQRRAESATQSGADVNEEDEEEEGRRQR